MESLVPEYSAQGFVRERSGASLPGISPSNTYLCRDGKHVVIAGNGDALFRRLMSAIDRSDLGTDPALAGNAGRVARNAELDAAIGAWTAQHDLETVITTLESAEVPVGKIYTAADICSDPHYAARHMLETHTLPDGTTLQLPGIVPKLSATPGTTHWLGPTLGEHTEEFCGRATDSAPLPIE
jgi:formyl-CoA transferase